MRRKVQQKAIIVIDYIKIVANLYAVVKKKVIY